MRLRGLRQQRNGVATVECAVVLGALLPLLVGIVDLGLAVCRYNVLSAAAGALTRSAIVRGAAAGPELATWGPVSWTGTAADSSDMAKAVAPFLCTMAANEVTIQVDWLDATNHAGNRVRAQLSYNHQPFTTIVGQWGTLHLQATSTMPIVH